MRVVLIIVQNDDGTVEARKPSDFSDIFVFPSSDDSTTRFWKNRQRVHGWILKEILYDEVVKYCTFWVYPTSRTEFFKKSGLDEYREGEKCFVWA